MLIAVLLALLGLAEPATATSLAAPAAAATQPATQPVHNGEYQPIDLKKLISGEQPLTTEQLLGLGPWVQLASDLALGVLGFIPRLFVALVLFLIFWLIYRGVRRVLSASMDRAGIDSSIRDMMVSLLKWATLGFGLVIAGNQIGIQIAAMLTGVSIIGLAVGFAAQETLANFIAGIVIFWDKPFRIGDWVEIDGVFAQVQRVTFRSTRLLNADGETVLFPNTYVLSNKLINHSVHPINRVSVAIGIAYKESIDKAREALLAVPRGDDRICTDPPPEVVVNECADSSVNLLLRFWIRDESVERRIRYEYTEKSKKALDSAGIEIPFPHMQVFLERTASIESLSASRA